MINAPLASNYVTGLGALNANAVLDYCAQAANSYPGSLETWQNLDQVDSPASPTPQSVGPLFLGSPAVNPSTAIPLTGFAGQTGSYFLMDGTTTFFTYSGRTGDNPKLVDGLWKNMHKTTGAQDITVAMMLTFKVTGLTQTLWSTKASGATNIGLTAFTGSSSKVNLLQRGDSATRTATGTYVLSDSTTYIVFTGHSNSLNETYISVYSHAGALLNAEVLSHTYNSTSAAATTGLFFGTTFDIAQTTASLPLANGTKVYAIAGFNAALTSGQMTTVAAAMAARAGV